MDRYAVVGNPIAHSKSPVIHARFAQLLGERLEYGTLLAPEDGFGACVAEFFANGGRGLNVTLPFKLQAFELAGAVSARADAAGAANLLMPRGEGLFADNTDGAGLVTDLRANLGFTLRGANVLMLGAGGAARGVLAPLLAQAPASLVIANRTAATAVRLAERFAHSGPVSGVSLESIPPVHFDLVINATSSSTRGEPLALPAQVIAPGALAYDMAYGSAALAFLDRARAAGARVSDGLGMLVEQAAESYFLWRGRRPPTAPVLTGLRSEAS